MVNKNFDKKWDTLEILHTIGIYLNGLQCLLNFLPLKRSTYSRAALIWMQHLFESYMQQRIVSCKWYYHF